MTHSWKTSDPWHVILPFWTYFLIWRNGNKLIRLLSWSKKTLHVKYIHGSEHTVCVQQMVTIINTVFKKERKLVSSESRATLLPYNPKYELPVVLKIVAPPLAVHHQLLMFLWFIRNSKKKTLMLDFYLKRCLSIKSSRYLIGSVKHLIAF